MARQKKDGLPKCSEKEFQKHVLDLAKMYRWRTAHFRAVRIARKNGEVHFETPVAGDGAGFLDTLFIDENRQPHVLFVAELKVPPNVATKEQMAWLNAWLGAGIPAFVWTPEDWRTIEAILRRDVIPTIGGQP